MNFKYIFYFFSATFSLYFLSSHIPSSFSGSIDNLNCLWKTFENFYLSSIRKIKNTS